MDERITVRMSAKLCECIDDLVDEGVYPNRSEALRQGALDLVREHGAMSSVLAGKRPLATDGGVELNHDTTEDTDG